jgi:four helix bundle protein
MDAICHHSHHSVVSRSHRLEEVDESGAERYKSTHAFPKTETYGLATQLRRAVVSIPSNIAEGQARLTTAEFKQSLGHARGSLMEVETYILLAQELGYLQNDESEGLLARTAEVRKILNGLLNSLARVTNH